MKDANELYHYLEERIQLRVGGEVWNGIINHGWTRLGDASKALGTISKKNGLDSQTDRNIAQLSAILMEFSVMWRLMERIGETAKQERISTKDQHDQGTSKSAIETTD